MILKTLVILLFPIISFSQSLNDLAKQEADILEGIFQDEDNQIVYHNVYLGDYVEQSFTKYELTKASKFLPCIFNYKITTPTSTQNKSFNFEHFESARVGSNGLDALFRRVTHNSYNDYAVGEQWIYNISQSDQAQESMTRLGQICSELLAEKMKKKSQEMQDNLMRFVRAVKENDLTTARELIQRGKVKKADYYLTRDWAWNHPRMMQFLVDEAGANVNFSSFYAGKKETPIGNVIESGLPVDVKINAMKFLIDKGADLSITVQNGSSLAHVLVYRNQDLEVIKKFFEFTKNKISGKSWNKKNNYSCYPADYSHSKEIKKILRKFKIKKTDRNCDYRQY